MYAFTTKASTTDENEITKVVIKGIKATHTSFVLPIEYQNNQSLKAGSDVIDKVKKNVEDELSDAYWTDSEPYKRYSERIRALPEIEATANQDRTLDGGVKKIRNMDIKVTGDIATVETDLTIFSKYKGPGGQIYSPENGCHYSFILTKKDGVWKISSEKWDFLPGEEP